MPNRGYLRAQGVLSLECTFILKDAFKYHVKELDIKRKNEASEGLVLQLTHQMLKKSQSS